MNHPADSVAEAFSRKALVYDDFGRDHPNLERMRVRVRRHVLRFLRPGDRILELNAGTGADAAFFASQGYDVHATDISPGMLAQAAHKAADPACAGRMSVERCSFTELERLGGEQYEYIFSNMGGVNCTQDLALVARGAAARLAPAGRVTWVVMPPVCPWELLQALRGDWKVALRRLRPGGVIADVEGLPVPTWYYTPRQVQAAFGRGFRRLELEALSLATPPADHKDFARRHPRLYAWLRRLDEAVCRWPLLRGWGDFFILTLERRPLGAER